MSISSPLSPPMPRWIEPLPTGSGFLRGNVVSFGRRGSSTIACATRKSVLRSGGMLKTILSPKGCATRLRIGRFVVRGRGDWGAARSASGPYQVEPAWCSWFVRKMVGPPRRGGRPAREAPERERYGPLGERALPGEPTRPARRAGPTNVGTSKSQWLRSLLRGNMIYAIMFAMRPIATMKRMSWRNQK